MLLAIIIFLLFIIALFISTSLLWCALGKLFKIEDITFKKALITLFVISLIGVAFQIIYSVSLVFNIDFLVFNLILSIAGFVLAIYILKVRFKTTILKAIGLHVSSVVFAVCFALLIRTYIVQAFKIPTGSLKPTILSGDNILINKLAYLASEPNPGDLIVFPGSEDPSKIFLKRTIGVDGDKIEIKNGVLLVNDNQVQLKKLGTYKDDSTENAEEYLESLGKTSYHILDENNFNDNFGPVTVPENSLFVLGDNRDNSMDSRHWGFIDKKTVKGKAVMIYWSLDQNNSKVRWDRIGISL